MVAQSELNVIHCGCGCGNTFQQTDSRGRRRNFVRGHCPKFKCAIPEDDLRKAYGSGLSQSQVADKFKTTRGRIEGAMKHYGISTRHGAERNQTGEKGGQWKGDRASYSAFHMRLRKSRGSPKKCEMCGTDDDAKRYEWANLTDKYEEPSDYKRMCAKCHRNYDGTAGRRPTKASKAR